MSMNNDEFNPSVLEEAFDAVSAETVVAEYFQFLWK